MGKCAVLQFGTQLYGRRICGHGATEISAENDSFFIFIYLLLSFICFFSPQVLDPV